MADKVASISEYSREDFFGPFVKYLREAQPSPLIVIDERKPDIIRFNATPVVTEGTIELRPAGKGFDIYVDMSFSFMYKFGGGLFIKGNVVNLILKAVSRAKAELASAPPPPPPPEAACPTCDGPLTYIEKYQRWYCYKCKKYA